MNWRSFVPPPSLLHDIVPLLPIATLFLSVAVGVVAWLQWRVARNKLRLDLFDRRYKVFEATRKFLALILQNTTFDNSQFAEFDLAISDADFLFGDDVVRYLREIRQEALDLRTSGKLLARARTDDEVTKRAQDEHAHLFWLNDQVEAMTKVFSPYLSFGHIK
jgi:hypothetical protein